MKKLTLVFLLAVTSLSAQNKISVEVNYPLPIDSNFMGDNYNGVVDLGLRWGFLSTPVVRVGMSLNAGMLTYKEDSAGADFKTTAYPIQPRAFAELSFPAISKLHPSAGIGYTAIVYSSSGTVGGVGISNSEAQYGLNYNIGVAYDIIPKLFVQAQYDFIQLNAPDGTPDTKYNTNVGMLKLGVGLRF